MRGTWIVAAAASALLPVAAAEAQPAFDWTGFYVGVHGGYIDGQVTIDGGMGGGNVSGPVFGVLAGRNFMRKPGSPYQWGVEGDFGWISAQGEGQSGPPNNDCSIDYYYDLNWNGHLRARVGLPSGNLMPFLAAGLAFTDLNLEYCQRGEPSGGVYVGGTVGGGFDFKLSPNLVGRGEFLYDFYGTKQYEYFSASLNTWTIRAALTWLLP